MIKKLICLFLIITFVILLPVTASAHSGRTDSKGGHWDRSTGEYHYHHGMGPHDHYDMDGDGKADCPYELNPRLVNAISILDAYDVGVSDGYADGYEKGLDDGYENGYSFGYDVGQIDAEEELEKRADEIRKDGAFNAYIQSLLFGSPLIAYIVSYFFARSQEKSNLRHSEEIEMLRQELNNEKNRNALLRVDPNSYLPPDIPADVTLGFTCIPIKGKATENRPFGEYTVYTTASGKKYHCKYRCCNASHPVHLFQISNELTACSNCVPPQSRFSQLPNWYLQIKSPQKTVERSPALLRTEKDSFHATISATPTNCESSAISFIDYQNTVLILMFRSGGEYHYYNVPKYVYEELLAAPSKGKYYHEKIKDQYPYY